MDMKKIMLIMIISLAIVSLAGAVSAGLFDGLNGGGKAQDNVVEIDNISFNATYVTKFKLYNEVEDEDGHGKVFTDENNTGYTVHIYNYSLVDNRTWNEMIQQYKDYQLNNSTNRTVNGIVVYATTATDSNHSGEPRYISYVQNNDLKTIVDFVTPNPNETAKMASTLEFK